MDPPQCKYILMMKGKTRMKRKWLGLLLVFAMVISLLPVIANPAVAATEEDVYVQAVKPEDGWTTDFDEVSAKAKE